MKGKSTYNSNKKEKTKEIIKEVGSFNDFLIMEKEKKTKIIDINDLDLKDWVQLGYSNEPKRNNSDKSRFADFFNEILEGDKKQNNADLKEEDSKKDESIKKSKSINSITITTNDDSKIFEGVSKNDSLFENTNIHEIIENKKTEKNEKIDETNLNLEINKVISKEDIRTTIMIKNIPNKFNRELLLSIINQNFKGTYDLFILPTDIKKYKNFGYAFINFTSSYYIPYFYYMFNGKMWSSTNSKKVCELTYSKVQGKTNLLNHFPIKIVYLNEEAYNVKPEQKYIIPNVYKIIFNKLFPEEKIEEFKFYFITKLPGKN